MPNLSAAHTNKKWIRNMYPTINGATMKTVFVSARKKRLFAVTFVSSFESLFQTNLR